MCTSFPLTDIMKIIYFGAAEVVVDIAYKLHEQDLGEKISI